MRPQKNPLDLNNLPDDSSRDHGKQHALDDASTGYRKKKNGGKEGKEECGKVYECRFCSLKFCKSQALGGHMNRHRQERETETLNRARQLVFTNDNLAPQPHLSCCHPMTQPPPGYHHAPPPGSDPTMPLRFPTRMFSGATSNFMPAPPVQSSPSSFLYPSPTRPISYSPRYPPHQQHGVSDHYYVGQVLGGNSNSPSAQYSFPNLNYSAGSGETEFACISPTVGFGAGFGRWSGSELAESGRSIRGDGSLR